MLQQDWLHGPLPCWDTLSVVATSLRPPRWFSAMWKWGDSCALESQKGMLLACTGDDASWVQALAKQRGSEGKSEGLTALAQAAALSVRSTHPVSQAVLACAQSAGSSLPQLQLQDFHQQPGVLSLVCYHYKSAISQCWLIQDCSIWHYSVVQHTMHSWDLQEWRHQSLHLYSLPWCSLCLCACSLYWLYALTFQMLKSIESTLPGLIASWASTVSAVLPHLAASKLFVE